MATTDFVGERTRLDACGDTFRTRIDAPMDAHGFFGIVPPNSAKSEILLGEVSAGELRDRLNAYLGESVNTVGYIVTAIRDDGSRWFMALDYASGGYEYWATDVGSALVCVDAEAAQANIDRRVGETFLHKASGADFRQPERRVRIGVERLDAVSLESAEHSFRIAVPPGFVASAQTIPTDAGLHL